MLFFLSAASPSKIPSNAINIWRLFAPKLSKAPPLIKFSTTRFCIFLPYIRLQKSYKDLKFPHFRSSIICSIGARPILLIASKPKRISLPSTVKRSSLSFTSGGKTLIPRLLHSSMYSTTLLTLSNTLVMSAAIYSFVYLHFK